jgi:hypothetical protein
MPYTVFERKTPRLGTPMMSFSRIGQVSFNQPAARILQREAIETVLLMWDSAERKLALKATNNKKDPRNYVIRYNEKGNGASFSAKTFLDHVGINYSERKAIPININPNNELFLEVAIPDSLFSQQALQPVAIRTTGT